MQRQSLKTNSCSKNIKESSRITASSSLFPSKNLTQKPKQTNLKPSKGINGSVHKEVFVDKGALIEVTVKSLHTNLGPKKKTNQVNNKKETWGDMLKSGRSVSDLDKIDPVKTLGFLTKELEEKLKNYDDSVIQQLLKDMSNAVNKISPSKLPLRRRAVSESRKSKPYSPRPVNSASIACQTEHKEFFDAEKFKKQWEESYEKLENNCKQLENLCTKYKREKEEIELFLKAEKDTVKYLRKKYDESKHEKQNKESDKKLQEMKSQNCILQYKLHEMKMENATLQTEIQKLRNQNDQDNHNPTKKELKALISDLYAQKNACDQEIIILKHHLAKVNMEKEKFQTICNLRSKQVEDIQAEMVELQKIVDENILDLQKSTFPSAPASVSSHIDSLQWSELMTHLDKTNAKNSKTKKCSAVDEQMGKEMGDNMPPSSINSDESSQALLFKDTFSDKISFKELPSGDSTNHLLKLSSSECSTPVSKRHLDAVPKSLSKDRLDIIIPGYANNSDAQSSIRHMFAELKRQALQVFPSLNIPFSSTSDVASNSIAYSDN